MVRVSNIPSSCACQYILPVKKTCRFHFCVHLVCLFCKLSGKYHLNGAMMFATPSW